MNCGELPTKEEVESGVGKFYSRKDDFDIFYPGARK